MKKIRTILHIQPDLAHDVKYSLFNFAFSLVCATCDCPCFFLFSAVLRFSYCTQQDFP